MKMPTDHRGWLHLSKTQVTNNVSIGRTLGRGKNSEENELCDSARFFLQDTFQKWPIDTGSPPQTPPLPRLRPLPGPASSPPGPTPPPGSALFQAPPPLLRPGRERRASVGDSADAAPGKVWKGRGAQIIPNPSSLPAPLLASQPP